MYVFVRRQPSIISADGATVLAYEWNQCFLLISLSLSFSLEFSFSFFFLVSLCHSTCTSIFFFYYIFCFCFPLECNMDACGPTSVDWVQMDIRQSQANLHWEAKGSVDSQWQRFNQDLKKWLPKKSLNLLPRPLKS